MKSYTTNLFFLLFFIGFPVLKANSMTVDSISDTTGFYTYIKKELNTGIAFNGRSERDVLRTDNTYFTDELHTGYGSFRFENRVWNYLSYKQEMMDILFDAGPFYGQGDWTDSTSIGISDVTHKDLGLRLKLAVDYESRYYYDDNIYSLIKINGWARNDLFNQNSDGIQVDSNMVSSDINGNDLVNKFRYGFQAKAAWGIGRMNPMNNYMVAEYILSNYYMGRVFSKEEIENLANKIGDIKQRRDPGIKLSSENELNEIVDFLRMTMFLVNPEMPEDQWELGEFMPRLNGTRFEFGPFFNYYNREPDFYYGGYMQFENAKYVSNEWNRNFHINLNYNHYKKSDWILAETNIGWSYYTNLKSELGFGIKYMPGVSIVNGDKWNPVRHNFIPYVEYFTQMNSSSRINFSLAWKIADSNEFMLPGPEFSMVIYRSRY